MKRVVFQLHARSALFWSVAIAIFAVGHADESSAGIVHDMLVSVKIEAAGTALGTQSLLRQGYACCKLQRRLDQ